MRSRNRKEAIRSFARSNRRNREWQLGERFKEKKKKESSFKKQNEHIKLQDRIGKQEHRPEGMGAC